MEIAVTRRSEPKLSQVSSQCTDTTPPRPEPSDTCSSGAQLIMASQRTGNNMKLVALTPRSSAVRRSPRNPINEAHSAVTALGMSVIRGETVSVVDPSVEMYGDMGESCAVTDDMNSDALEVAAAARNVTRNLREVKVEVLGGSALDPSISNSREKSMLVANDSDENADELDQEDEEDETDEAMADVKVKVLDEHMDEALADESAMLARFACNECGMKFARHSAMRQHARKMHATRIGVQCEVCGKAFRYLGSLPRHMLLHASIKPFSCAVCGAQFAQKGDLQRHDRLHTGERPFACPECSATFNREYSLKKHIRVHTGERPYACSVCERRFASRSSVTRHSHTHAPRASHSHAHAHAAYSPGGYATAAYQVDPVDQVDQPDDFDQPDATEIELTHADHVEEDDVDEAQVELVAAIAQQAAASSSGVAKRRRKDERSRNHMGRSHVASNDEPDSESLEQAWLMATR